MTTLPVTIVRHTRTRSYEPANVIDTNHAMRMCQRHFLRNDCNYVEINGRLCWTLYQAEKQILTLK